MSQLGRVRVTSCSVLYRCQHSELISSKFWVEKWGGREIQRERERERERERVDAQTWKRNLEVPTKCWYTSSKLHGVTVLQTVTLLLTHCLLPTKIPHLLMLRDKRLQVATIPTSLQINYLVLFDGNGRIVCRGHCSAGGVALWVGVEFSEVFGIGW